MLMLAGLIDPVKRLFAKPKPERFLPACRLVLASRHVDPHTTDGERAALAAIDTAPFPFMRDPILVMPPKMLLWQYLRDNGYRVTGGIDGLVSSPLRYPSLRGMSSREVATIMVAAGRNRCPLTESECWCLR